MPGIGFLPSVILKKISPSVIRSRASRVEKSAGAGLMNRVALPSPLPVSPWQEAHRAP